MTRAVLVALYGALGHGTQAEAVVRVRVGIRDRGGVGLGEPSGTARTRRQWCCVAPS